MKTMGDEEFKANSPERQKNILAREEIDIIDTQKKEAMAKLAPKPTEKKEKRKIGILDGKVKIKFRSDFKMTEDEFLGL